MNTAEELAAHVTCVVTIGHNGPNDQPMPEATIAAFRHEVAIEVVVAAGAQRGTIYAHGNTEGVYQRMPEMGSVWIFTTTGHHVRVVLRPQLAKIAAKFGQEAIGLIVQCNTDTLVTAS